MKKILCLAAILACVGVSPMAVAQTYPVKPVTLTVGFAPGGNADTLARVLAREMASGLGKPVQVEGKPGAGGNIAAAAVAHASPDGHTLLLITGGHAVSGALYKSLGYKTLDSFEPIAVVTSFPFLIAAKAESADNTLPALLARAKAKPGAVMFGSAGIGSTQHLTGELLASMAQTPMTHVPYKGDSAALVALLGGEVDFIVAPPAAIMAQLKAGKVKALAVSGGSRWRALSEVPTVAESGVAGFDVQSWLGLATTAGTPKPVVDRLSAEVQRVTQIPAVRTAIESMGSDITVTSPDETRKRMATELQRWTKVIDEARIERQ